MSFQLDNSKNTIRDFSKAIRDGVVSCEDLFKYFVFKSKEDTHNAYITINEDEGLGRARKLDHFLQKNDPQLAQMPLFGIPVAVKDNIITKGLKTTCASKVLADYVPPYQSDAVNRLIKAGTIILGKTNLDEFGMGGSSEYSAFGPVLNPTNKEFVAGGSSGGSAVAVAAHLAPVALGSDTGGSIRLPAAFTGVVGFKPTYGTVSRFGLIAYASSLDQIGPMAKSVEDVHALFQVLEYGRTQIGPESLNAQKIDTVIVPDFILKSSSIDLEVRQLFEKFLEKFSRVEFISWDSLKYVSEIYYIIAMSEASSNLGRFDGLRFGQSSDEFGKEVHRRIALGEHFLSQGYYGRYFLKASTLRNRLIEEAAQIFQNGAVMALPSSSELPYKLGSFAQDPLKMYALDQLTVPANLIGLPAVSLPMGTSKAGLPIGVQLWAWQKQDRYLLSVAKFIEGQLQK